MTEPPTAERAVGMELYATPGPPCAGRAKVTPGDFRVEEVISAEGLEQEWSAGKYPLYRVEKRSIDTMHMARELSSGLKSRVSYGGMKDSRAVAVQYVTPTSLRSSRPARVEGARYEASLVGYLPRPLSRSSVVANRFEVVLRDCGQEIGERVAEALRLAEARALPNYYGLQRFGASSPGTHSIGRAMVKGDFGGAVKLLVGGGTKGEEGASLPKGKDMEMRVSKALASHPGEWVRALRAIPVNLRRLYVQAYQSYIFNEALSTALKKDEDLSGCRRGDNWASCGEDGLLLSRVRGVREDPTADAVPLIQMPGYAYRDYGSRFDRCTGEALKAEGVVPAQFYLKEMQEASSEGGFRRPHLAVRDAKWDAHEGTARLSFTLARGQYATVLLREMLKPHDPVASGLF